MNASLWVFLPACLVLCLPLSLLGGFAAGLGLAAPNLLAVSAIAAAGWVTIALFKLRRANAVRVRAQCNLRRHSDA